METNNQLQVRDIELTWNIYRRDIIIRAKMHKKRKILKYLEDEMRNKSMQNSWLPMVIILLIFCNHLMHHQLCSFQSKRLWRLPVSECIAGKRSQDCSQLQIRWLTTSRRTNTHHQQCLLWCKVGIKTGWLEKAINRVLLRQSSLKFKALQLCRIVTLTRLN